jgi:hypothetical protein
MKAKIKFTGKIILYALFLIIGTSPILVIAFILGGIDTVTGTGLYDSFYRVLEKIKYWLITGRRSSTLMNVRCIDCKKSYEDDDNNYWCQLKNCIVDPLTKEECPSFEPTAKNSRRKSWQKNDR